jgi:DNA repair exonuclease SbcCD ATPase subunit
MKTTQPPSPEAVEAARKLVTLPRTPATRAERLKLGQVLMEADPECSLMSIDAQAARLLDGEVGRLAAQLAEAQDRAHNFEHGYHIHSARADEAEAKYQHFIHRDERYKLAVQEADQLRAQLAAAQAELEIAQTKRNEEWERIASEHLDTIQNISEQRDAAQAKLDSALEAIEQQEHQVVNAQAEALRLRGIAGEAISAMASVRTDRIHETESDIWALQTLEWAEWLLERAEHLSAALAKEGGE